MNETVQISVPDKEKVPSFAENVYWHVAPSVMRNILMVSITLSL